MMPSATVASTARPARAYLDSAPLSPGDVVTLVAPSGPTNEQSIEWAVGYLEGLGLEVRLGANILARDPRARYMGGSDDQRRADLVAAWTDPGTDAVVCARGGYGAMRLIDGIDWQQMAAAARRRDGRPKLLTGSSDITALHEAFRCHLGVPSLFCPMPGNDVFKDSALIQDDVTRWLTQPWRGRRIAGPRAEVMVPGSVHGWFRGGNLSLLAAGIGAREAAPSAQPEILLLEDVGEEVYRLDNLMIQMARSGRLAGAVAVLLGSWRDCGDPHQIRALMTEYLSGLGVPVAWEVGFGHDRDARSIPLNVPGVVDLPEGGPVTVRVG